MLKAKEARRIADEFNYNTMTLMLIMDAVADAAAAGQGSIDHVGELDQKELGVLYTYGYGVTQVEPGLWRIQW